MGVSFLYLLLHPLVSSSLSLYDAWVVRDRLGRLVLGGRRHAGRDGGRARAHLHLLERHRRIPRRPPAPHPPPQTRAPLHVPALAPSPRHAPRPPAARLAHPCADAPAPLPPLGRRSLPSPSPSRTTSAGSSICSASTSTRARSTATSGSTRVANNLLLARRSNQLS
ncbi:hypothetical protein C8R47DRAFT_309901 [Mycena vitilis]|nr:hypothetical protein C8R47DRAFT_309901 [Mycena vitilis]